MENLTKRPKSEVLINRRRLQQDAGFFQVFFICGWPLLMLDSPEEMLGLEHTVLKKPCRTTCPCEGVVDAS